jgi:hypothetical protein
MSDAAPGHCILQCPANVLLPHDVLKGLGAVLEGEGLIGHGAGITDQRSGNSLTHFDNRNAGSFFGVPEHAATGEAEAFTSSPPSY